MTNGEEARESMSSPKDGNRQKALALTALENGIVPRTTWGLAYHTVKMESCSPCCVDAPECDSPIEALAAAAVSLGLEPDPILQPQPLNLHPAQYAHLERAITNALARLDELGHPHAVGCDLAGAWGMLKGILQQQEQTPPGFVTVPQGLIDGQGVIAKENVRARQENAGLRSFIGTLGHEIGSFLELHADKAQEYSTQAFGLLNRLETLIDALPSSEAQQEQTPAGMVRREVADYAIHKAVEATVIAIIKKEPHTAMRAGNLINIDAEACGVGAEALANPPKEIAASDLPTPTDLHRSIGSAQGLVKTAIGQLRDLGGPHASAHLWDASRHLGWAISHIKDALASTPDPQEGGKSDA